MAHRLIKFKVDDTYNLIIYELAESLIFNKLYSFIFMNLKQFNEDVESLLKTKLETMKNDFNFSSYEIDSIFSQCNYEIPIYEFQKISTVTTPFEKLAVLSSVCSAVLKEVNDINEEKNKYNKVKTQITANELVPIWMFLIIYSDIDNIITEVEIIQDFMLKDTSLMNETGYHLTNLITAIEMFKDKDAEHKTYKSIQPYYVISPRNVLECSYLDDSRSSLSQNNESVVSKLNIFK